MSYTLHLIHSPSTLRLRKSENFGNFRFIVSQFVAVAPLVFESAFCCPRSRNVSRRFKQGRLYSLDVEITERCALTVHTWQVYVTK